MNSANATLKRKRSLNENDLSCSTVDPDEKAPRNQENRDDARTTNSCAELFNSVALPNADVLRKVRENASNAKDISRLGSAGENHAENHSPACNTRFQSWVNERKDRERIRNVEQATRYYPGILWKLSFRKVLEEVRARKDTVYVQYHVVHEDESTDEEEEGDLCFQYDVDTLPPVEIDLDEIDDFLEHDIFMQEQLE
jgi:hypothetical protein